MSDQESGDGGKVRGCIFLAAFCLNYRVKYKKILWIFVNGVEWSLLGAIGIHCAYYFTYIPYNYQ